VELCFRCWGVKSLLHHQQQLIILLLPVVAAGVVNFMQVAAVQVDLGLALLFQ
jgi:uncharacterized membrane protein